MFLAPQDKFVELCHNNESHVGRYAVAKVDIKSGDLVLRAAPYALAVNPNESASAMYLAAKIDMADGTTGKRRITNATPSSSATKSCSRKRSDNTVAANPPTQGVALCCSCMQVIPTGTLLLNYETIRQVSVDVAAEIASEEERPGHSLSADHVKSTEDGVEDADTVTIHSEHKAKKNWQKPTRSTRMRSKGYIALKATLAAQREAAKNASDGPHRNDWFHAAQPLVWPERAIPLQPRDNENSDGRTEDKNTAEMSGCCGCAGCGVVMYCSARCWAEYHAQHVSSGECRVLRRVYPELMRAYFTKHATSSGQKMRSQVWTPTSWMPRINEKAAWEVQLLLLSALVVERCTVDGFAAHLTESAVAKDLTGRCIGTQDGIMDTLRGFQEVHIEKDGACPVIDAPFADSAGADHCYNVNDASEVIYKKNNNSQNNNNNLGPGCDSSSAPYEGCASVSRGFATDSEVPSEVEKIRVTRERTGASLEVLDSLAAESQPVADTDWLTDRSPHWRDVARLVTNFSVLPKEFFTTARNVYRAFTRHVAPQLALAVSAMAFDRLSAAVSSNGFGVYNAMDQCVALGLYPAASYFNHNCRPNLCRVMRGGRVAAFYAIRDIECGEPLSICYVDVQEASTAERRRLLLSSYRFYCQCERCSGRGTKAAGVQLCVECTTQGYMRPLQGTNEAECTICRTRSLRQEPRTPT